ncbi:hypothetical protein DFP93_103142 [Aneurinibacillus soli]|uniref:Uncharacterized protein n=1 Tax=Aneurinibacillus soli TaxID=1500254 RepID=A0A0U5B320_9BACL|nr:hypothetical protein [Aneurinibacillus soli]PYE62931.1 hypothetical protein DFP93_103142 [Aneurinibacillus soli]BAU29010.1 hypothetical protein CB4_03188 [Aneurinibacillus soli]
MERQFGHHFGFGHGFGFGGPFGFGHGFGRPPFFSPFFFSPFFFSPFFSPFFPFREDSPGGMYPTQQMAPYTNASSQMYPYQQMTAYPQTPQLPEYSQQYGAS